MEREIIRTHRVGSVTFGATLVVIGVLFLLHVFFPGMGYGGGGALWVQTEEL